MKLKLIETNIIPIYEDDKKEKLVNARELFKVLESKQEFANWIKNRIQKYDFVENVDFFKHDNFITLGNLKRPQIDYYLTLDTAKEISMIENNEVGRQIRRYFIEAEKRYREITTTIQKPSDLLDIMQIALDYMRTTDTRFRNLEESVEEVKKDLENKKTDVIIKKDYCLASDIAEQLGIYSESDLPHSNFIGAVARQLGYKNTYKHYYEDEFIAIVTDLSKGNDFWQVFYKPKAVNEIIGWFNANKYEIEYKIIYEKKSKNGVKGTVREIGYKVDKICYKIKF